MHKLILVGGGGHCKSCIDVIEQTGEYEIIGILDKVELLNQKVLGYEIIGSDDDMEKYVQEECLFLISVGQIRSSSVRKMLFSKLEACHANIATVISPHATVSRYAKIGKGTIIMHHALVNADAVIGQNTIINSKALIEHDVTIEDHCHISTAAVVNGGSVIKEGSFFGSNAVCKEYITTQNDDFISAGSIYKG